MAVCTPGQLESRVLLRMLTAHNRVTHYSYEANWNVLSLSRCVVSSQRADAKGIHMMLERLHRFTHAANLPAPSYTIVKIKRTTPLIASLVNEPTDKLWNFLPL